MVEEQRLKVAFHYGCFAIARRGTKQNKSNVRSSLEVKEIVALGQVLVRWEVFMQFPSSVTIE